MTMTVTNNRPGSTTQADRSIRLNADPHIFLLPTSHRTAPRVNDLLCLNVEEAQFLMAAFARILEVASVSGWHREHSRWPDLRAGITHSSR
jgi:hypothetical protein